MRGFLDYAMIEIDGRKPSVTVYHFDGPSVNGLESEVCNYRKEFVRKSIY